MTVDLSFYEEEIHRRHDVVNENAR